jgi:predicted Zn-ribbon and HTH transcriptional regulator
MKLDYTLEELEAFFRSSVAPCHCARCGAYVFDAEPDFQDDSECPECEESTEILSVLVLEGLI